MLNFCAIVTCFVLGLVKQIRTGKRKVASCDREDSEQETMLGRFLICVHAMHLHGMIVPLVLRGEMWFSFQMIQVSCLIVHISHYTCQLGTCTRVLVMAICMYHIYGLENSFFN